MKTAKVEFLVGLFLLVGAMCAAYMFVFLGGFDPWGDKDRYSLYAGFDSVSGLKKGANVEIAGVVIGEVGEIKLDHEKFVAVIRLDLANEIKLTDDTIASVKTSGLIGDKFINLLIGGSEEILKNGNHILDTESAINIEDLISKYIFSDDDEF